jgi:hypothetical protein
MFNVYSIENQNFYLNDNLISGIKNFNVSVDSQIDQKIAIDDQIDYITKGLTSAQFDLSYILSDSDKFLNFTGINSFSGKIEYGNNYISFTSGFLTNYSLNYRLGEYPNVNIKGIIYGWDGSNQISFTPQAVNLTQFNPGDACFVDTNIDLFSQNRIESFSINIDVNRITNYTIGNYLPDLVYIQYPIKQEISIDSSISNTAGISNTIYRPASGYVSTDKQYISIKKYQSNLNLITFNFDNIILNTNSSFNDDSDAKFNITRINLINP